MIDTRKALLSAVAVLLVATPGFASAHQEAAEAVVGEWEMVTEFQGQRIAATMKISVEDGELVGVWTSQGEDMPMHEVKIDGKTLTFNREMGRGGAMLSFEGTVEDDEISGKWMSDMGELPCNGKRKS